MVQDDQRFHLHHRFDAGWLIQSSQKVKQSGSEISSHPKSLENWYPATVPGTVFNTLIRNQVYNEVFLGDNLKRIDRAPFETSWWFVNIFELSGLEAEKYAVLDFDGINYKASVWLNGHLIADDQHLEGPFRRYHFNVSEQIRPGRNILAVEVSPPQPGQFSIGFVDWNPRPPDRNMGIFRPVTLQLFDIVHIENPFIETKLDTQTLDVADLIISIECQNYSDRQIEGKLRGKIENIYFEQVVSLRGGEKKLISFTSDKFPRLKIQNPRVWWPNHMGPAEMYEAVFEFDHNHIVSDSLTQAFGIRSVGDFLNEEGHRGFIINGRKILIKGAGWTDEIFLGDTADAIETQLTHVKHMNLNCIRLEGLWGKDQTLYDLCDRLGILIMAGWSCHWEHELHLGKPVHPRYGGITAPDDIDLIARSWQDQVIWLRNHPSIFVWSVASDMVPHPDLEKRYMEIFARYDRTRAYLNSTGGVGSDQNIITKTEIISDLSGSSGVKMLGPYDHTPPVYWYTNKHLGGAYGFNTETCPGANVPPLESIKKMIPEKDLWPVNEIWDYHCALYEFGTLDRFREALEKRYGKSGNVEDFAAKSQMMNYELMRPMFEAFQVNKGKATGIIQWMLNSAWPAMYWQLYDYYLRPNGAYYGVRKACEPLHLIYHYGEHAVYLVNDYDKTFNNYRAAFSLINDKSETMHTAENNLNIRAESSQLVFEIPEIDDISGTYFLDLRLKNEQEQIIGKNFYWLSTKPDVLDYEFKFKDFAFYTPSKEFADLSGINNLPVVQLKADYRFEQKNDGNYLITELQNPTDTLAFFVELSLRQSGEVILPVFWEDNYISLLPREKRQISAKLGNTYHTGDKPLLDIKGWNAAL